MSEPLQQIRDAVENATPIAAPPANDAGKKTTPKEHNFGLPDNCPVIPLGINESRYYYLDAMRQLREMSVSDHTRLGILSLFGTQSELLYHFWPRHSKDSGVVGWRPELCAESLMASAAARGVLDVVDRVRGPGAWLDENDELVIHCGDVLYHKDEILEPGRIGRHVYPSAPEKSRPAKDDPGGSAAEELLSLLKTWNWRRKDMDPQMLLGWIGASMLGGALKWRPLAWITGDKATGKSTLHDILKLVHGPGGLISASDASAAGLWQSVGHASLPIALDEIEAEEDNRKNANIIKLARHAASGGNTVRGGSDHKGTHFTVRNCFLFSSILMPPMMAQDVSRMAVLQLDKLEGTTPPRLEPKRLAEIGAGLRRRLMCQWHRMPETLEIYRQMLAEAGHGGRAADLFGTLLACHDLLLYEAVPTGDELSEWREKFNRDTLAETQDDTSDHDRCVTHMLTVICDVYRNGEKRNIGSWIEQAAKENGVGNSEANRVLNSFGLKVDHYEGQQYLFVANSGNGISTLFKDTHWAGRSGTTGVWVQALRRIPDAEAHGGLRFEGITLRCTRIPIQKILQA